MPKTLVIVESPAKCKKIEDYLGPGYKVMASFGHLRCLPDLESIDITNNFKPTFSLIKEPIKLKQIEKIRNEIINSAEVILACDDDREGESICWHICDLFSLPVNKTKRIIFHEITESAIKHAIVNPTNVNMNIVNSQMSRQILDLLVGFNITPILWNCISKHHYESLSAGRCQTPALRLVYENHLDINNSPGKLLYNTTGYFTNLNLVFDLNKQFDKKDDVEDFLNKCNKNEYIFNVTSPKKTFKKPPEPLITSSLQQLSNNELHFSPKETMKYAQELYENGYITYMRTDTKKYSREFVSSVKEYLTNIYDETYVSQNIDALSGTGIQEIKEIAGQNTEVLLTHEPHEAIRPLKITTTTIPPSETNITQKAHKLYELIWKKTIESCMPSAQYNSITAKITAPDSLFFSYKVEQIIFPGWQIINKKYDEDQKVYSYFQNLKGGSILSPKKIESKFSLVELKTHFSEAHLVKLLEEKGIGRPSTFASLIDKIQERKYVEKKNIEGREITGTDFSLKWKEEIQQTEEKRIFGNEKNKLVITQLGVIVIEFLLENFDTFFKYDYTKHMEDELDLIAKGQQEWQTLCNNCNNEVREAINLSKKEKVNIKIDNNYSIIVGKYGPVVKHIDKDKNISFLPIKKNLDLKTLQNKEQIELKDVVENTTTEEIGKSIGKYKGENLFIKKGKYGIYAQWGTNKKSLSKDFSDTPIDKIEYLEVLKMLEKDNLLDPTKPVGLVRELELNLSIRNGKFGDYIYYKKPRDKKPSFFKLNGFKEDYRTCNKDVIINWIKQTYKI